eukprot:scaffold15565_cov41-Cyclotella_meneghiniana.AAC.1
MKIFNAASVVFAMVESSIFEGSGNEKSLCQSSCIVRGKGREMLRLWAAAHMWAMWAGNCGQVDGVPAVTDKPRTGVPLKLNVVSETR